jgi:hypothetical protein
MRALAGQTADIFPVFFPVIGNFRPETGSQVTAPSAIQSAQQRIVL